MTRSWVMLTFLDPRGNIKSKPIHFIDAVEKVLGVTRKK
jgi:hypothetical protein